MPLNLVPLPAGITGADLVTQLNDRLRRIASGVTTIVEGKPGAAGAAGWNGSLKVVTVATSPYNVAVDVDIVVLVAGANVVNFPDQTLISREHIFWFMNRTSDCTIEAFAGQTVMGGPTLVIPGGANFALAPNT